jgi:uncharacterized protein
MSLHTDIKNQVKDAMRERNALKLNVLRGLISNFTNEAIAKKKKPDEELTDDEVLTVIGRAVKQRKDSIEQFEKGGRSDLVENEQAELAILESYLPAQMPKEDIVAYVKEKHAELNLPKDKMGQFTGMIMKDLKGKADGAVVKEAVEALFN